MQTEIWWLICKIFLSNHPVVIPQSYCDVHLLRSPWPSLVATTTVQSKYVAARKTVWFVCSLYGHHDHKVNKVATLIFTAGTIEPRPIWSQIGNGIDKSVVTIGLLICTLISENQGLEKSRSYSNLRKISGPANLDFF